MLEEIRNLKDSGATAVRLQPAPRLMATWRTGRWGLKPLEAPPFRRISAQEADAISESECFLLVLAGFQKCCSSTLVSISLLAAHEGQSVSFIECSSRFRPRQSEISNCDVSAPSPPGQPFDLFLKTCRLPFQVPVLCEGELRSRDAGEATSRTFCLELLSEAIIRLHSQPQRDEDGYVIAFKATLAKNTFAALTLGSPTKAPKPCPLLLGQALKPTSHALSFQVRLL